MQVIQYKYMITSTQITNTEIFVIIAVLVLLLLSRKVLFIKQKRQKKLLISRLLFKKIANFTGKYSKIINNWDANLSGYF